MAWRKTTPTDSDNSGGAVARGTGRRRHTQTLHYATPTHYILHRPASFTACASPLERHRASRYYYARRYIVRRTMAKWMSGGMACGGTIRCGWPGWFAFILQHGVLATARNTSRCSRRSRRRHGSSSRWDMVRSTRTYARWRGEGEHG